MKACHENKTKILLLGVRETILAANALVNQAARLRSSSKLRLTIWFVPPDNAIVFTSCRQ